MPEKDNKRRPLELIKQWRDGILKRSNESSGSLWTLAKKLLSGEKPNLNEYGTAFDKMPEKMQKRALNVAMRVIPTYNPKSALSSYFHSSNRSGITNDLKYVALGIGKPSIQHYTGLDLHKNEPPKPDIIDAVVFNKQVNSEIGVPVVDNDYGILTNYKSRLYPNETPQFIETRPNGTKSQEGIKSLGVVPITLNGSFKTSNPNIEIDNAGYSLEHGTRNDSTFVRGWDVYDFKSADNDKSGFNKKWLNGNKEETDIVNKLSNLIHPLFIRTPWVYYKDVDKIINGGIDLNYYFDK